MRMKRVYKNGLLKSNKNTAISHLILTLKIDIIKKQSLKSLKLNKRLVSNFQFAQLKGGYKGTEDVTNCMGVNCLNEQPKSLDGCDTFGAHTSRNPEGGVPTNCDVGG